MSECSHVHHNCQKNPCTCGDVANLTNLYEKLRCLRKKVKQIKNSSTDNTIKFLLCPDEIEACEKDAAAILKTVNEQQERTKNLLYDLNQLNERLSKWDFDLQKSEDEINELTAQIKTVKCTLKTKCEQRFHEIEANEARWRETVACEVQEQIRLKKKYKALNESLQKQKSEKEEHDKRRQEEKELDTKMLLSAVDCIETVIKECKIQCCKKTRK